MGTYGVLESYQGPQNVGECSLSRDGPETLRLAGLVTRKEKSK